VEQGAQRELMQSAIETIDLTRQFNGLTAVDKLNITVEKGEVFGLLGPNGAGKTTTISMLCTILRPTAGKATVNGFDLVMMAIGTLAFSRQK
jgi:ABC-2 type transport system ATP-binding protein